MSKIWAVIERTKDEDSICRFGGMENSVVGPWDMLAIFPSKRAAVRARDAFRREGFKKITITPVKVVPWE